jgi:hypothetical protein
MKTRTDALIAEWESDDQERYFTRLWYGWEWWQLSPEEESVFRIDRGRFPRMMAALEAYQALVGVFWHGHVGFRDQDIEEAKAHFKFDPDDYAVEDFKRFAKEYAGLTHREAWQVWCKYEFYDARAGHLVFPDEENSTSHLDLTSQNDVKI